MAPSLMSADLEVNYNNTELHSCTLNYALMHSKLECQDMLNDAVQVELRARLGLSKFWFFNCLWAPPTKSL